MIEQTVRDRFRDAVAGEPPLGFDPDEVVDRAISADETRRSAIAEFERLRGEQKVLGKQIPQARGDEKAALLDQTKELVPARTRLLANKVVVDPSNPIRLENGQMIRTLPQGQSSGSVVASLLPASAHYVKAFGTLGADQLATSANRDPRIVLFYATDDDTAEATAQRLIKAAGFEPLKVGGVSDAGRIEGPDGELQGRILDLDEAQATIATEGVKA